MKPRRLVAGTSPRRARLLQSLLAALLAVAAYSAGHWVGIRDAERPSSSVTAGASAGTAATSGTPAAVPAAAAQAATAVTAGTAAVTGSPKPGAGCPEWPIDLEYDAAKVRAAHNVPPPLRRPGFQAPSNANKVTGHGRRAVVKSGLGWVGFMLWRPVAEGWGWQLDDADGPGGCVSGRHSCNAIVPVSHCPCLRISLAALTVSHNRTCMTAYGVVEATDLIHRPPAGAAALWRMLWPACLSKPCWTLAQVRQGMWVESGWVGGWGGGCCGLPVFRNCAGRRHR